VNIAVLLAHHEVAQAGGPTEADWIRWTGLALAVVGTFVAAPSGVAHLLHTAAWPWRTLVFAAGGWVGWVFGKWLGALMAAVFETMASDSDKKGSDEEPGRGLPIQLQWAESEPLEAKVEQLRSGLEQVAQQILDVRRDAQAADAELRVALAQVSGDLRTVGASLNSRMDAADQRAAKIDSRGIVLLGASVILTGIPDGLARIAWVGWLTVGVAVFLLLGILLALRREWLGQRPPTTAAVP
jgi:hypothetical protein